MIMEIPIAVRYVIVKCKTIKFSKIKSVILRTYVSTPVYHWCVFGGVPLVCDSPFLVDDIQ